MSWDEAFADHYDEWSANMTADVAFYVEFARQADGPLVELAIGNGRVAIPVARATGRRVIGIDSSPAMLAQARARAAETGVELDLREGDMRDIARDDGATSSLWWATKNEWLGLLDVAGLQLEALYAGFAREPFTDDSREYVFVARRRL
jgi:SAM-dependent methyltransferase